MNRCMTSGLMDSQTIQWGTPYDLFDKLDREFHFTLDVCASDGMEMCERYFNPQIDGLKQEWGGGGGMLDEPPVWKGDNRMGEEGSIVSSDHRRLTSGKDGYEMVSGMGPAVCFGDTLHKWQDQVQREYDGVSPVPLNHRHLQHSEDSEIWSD